MFAPLRVETSTRRAGQRTRGTDANPPHNPGRPLPTHLLDQSWQTRSGCGPGHDDGGCQTDNKSSILAQQADLAEAGLTPTHSVRIGPCCSRAKPHRTCSTGLLDSGVGHTRSRLITIFNVAARTKSSGDIPARRLASKSSSRQSANSS